MPCVAMTPTMPTPHDGRCGANAATGGACSATIRPLPTHHHILTVPDSTTQMSSSVYTRFWKFLFHYWNSSQPNPLDDPSTTSTSSSRQHQQRRHRTRLSASSEMRQRVEMLHELEAHTHMRGARAMQATCSNCRQRFFRALGADAAVSTADKTAEYCSLDCKTSAQYRATVQDSIDHAGAFEDLETFTNTSRL